MLKILGRAPAAEVTEPALRLVLPFDLRSKTRQRTQAASGEELGLFLDRGQVLRDGDRLLTEDGRVVLVVAEPEAVSTVHCVDARQMARAAYHLGNRHVAVQIGDGWLRYRHDHVLDDMLKGFGLEVTVEVAAFEPEGGAYEHHTHSHA